MLTNPKPSHLPKLSPEERLKIAREKTESILVTLPKKQQEYINSNVPNSNQRLLAEAFSGSRAKAIKAKCLTCSNFQKEEVQNCTVMTCPLFTVRPFQSSNELEDSEDISE